MPALVFYGGYRSFLAGDDLGILTVFAMLFRVVQLIVIVAITIIVTAASSSSSSLETALRRDVNDLEELCNSNNNNNNANNNQVVVEFTRERLLNHAYELSVTYLVSSYVTAVFGLILELCICKAGSKGTPVQQDERAALRPMCCIKLIPMSLLRIFNMILGVMMIYILRQSCSCAGTTNDFRQQCPNFYAWQGWVACLIVTHFIEAGMVGLFALCFLQKTAGRAPLPACFQAETKWKFFCKCCCTVSALLTCCCYGGMDSSTTTDFTDIGIIMADFFDSGGILDVVLSDIMLGIRMLARVQKLHQDAARKELMDLMKTEEGRNGDSNDDDEGNDADMADWLVQRDKREDRSHHLDISFTMNDDRDGDEFDRKKRRQSVIYQIQHDSTTNNEVVSKPAIRAILSASNQKDALVIAEGARFIHLSNSIYDFKVNAVQSNLAHLCSTIGESGRRTAFWCCANAEEKIENTFLGKPVGAGFQIAKYVEQKFLKMAGLEDATTELVYVQFGVGLARTPYCVSLDHAWKSIVIAIRGTYSLDDVVADLTIKPESMEKWGTKCNFDGKDCFVHAGMLRCSEWIYNDLETYVYRESPCMIAHSGECLTHRLLIMSSL